MGSIIIDIINKHKNLLKQNNYNKFYNILDSEVEFYSSHSLFTDFFMKDCGINIFEYLDELRVGMFCKSTQKEVIIPDKYDTIPVGCFMFSQIEKIKLPKGLREIEANAFNHSNIREIRIPSTVILIDPDAFRNCEQLTKISISENTMNSVDIASLKINENGGTARVEIYK